MKEFCLSAVRPCSVVLVVAPSQCGSSALIHELAAHSLKTANRVTVRSAEESSVLDGDLSGKLVVVEGVPLRQLRQSSLRQVFAKEERLDVDLIAAESSLFQLSQLEFRNADYLCVKDVPYQELRKLSKLCRYSMKTLIKASRQGWLIVDRRNNQLYVHACDELSEADLPEPEPQLRTTDIEAAQANSNEAAETTKDAAEAAQQGWYDYLWSFVY